MTDRVANRSQQRWLAERTEVVMFAAAVTFLVCMAILVVLWVDMPGLQERAKSLVFDETAAVDAGENRRWTPVKRRGRSSVGGAFVTRR